MKTKESEPVLTMDTVKNPISSAQQSTQQQQQPTQNTADKKTYSGQFARHCWRCDRQYPSGGKFMCNCGMRPMCSICSKMHMDKWHDVASRVGGYGASRQSNTVATLTEQILAVLAEKEKLKSGDVAALLLGKQESKEIPTSTQWSGIYGRVNSTGVRMLLDSGATFCAISEEFYKNYIAKTDHTRAFCGQGFTANNQGLEVEFGAWLSLEINNAV